MRGTMARYRSCTPRAQPHMQARRRRPGPPRVRERLLHCACGVRRPALAELPEHEYLSRQEQLDGGKYEYSSV